MTIKDTTWVTLQGRERVGLWNLLGVV